ncbi:MAG: DNA primase [bacterium]
MAGRIPQNFIDDLLDRSDIVEVVGSRVPLKKSGKNYSACCPFHDEKTPSFTVSPDKQFYYCFGCGAGGNSIGFLMDFERVGFIDAVESLAQRLGLEVPREQGSGGSFTRKNQQLYDLLERVDRYYRTQLRKHPGADAAITYLKQRGLSGEIAAEFGIGFAPPGWDNLLNSLGEPDEPDQLLTRVGLLVANPDNNSIYDRFRNRVMFPIRDVRGRVIGFGGRVLGDDKPKYLNSPETPVFHKGRELYGLYEANRALKEIRNLLVVEGYMDVLALAQFGIRNAVATLGTAATAEHMDKLFRYAPEVVFCFDGDEAGRRAAKRAMENVLPVMIDGRSAKFLFLPEGEDPDSLVRAIGAEGFNQRIKKAQPLSEFLFSSLGADTDLDSMDGRARLSKLAAPAINRLPEGVFKDLMLSRLSEMTGLASERLKELISPPEPDEPDIDDASGHRAEAGEQWQPQQAYEGYDESAYPEMADYGDAVYGGASSGPPGAAENGYQKRRKVHRLPAIKVLIAHLLNNPSFAQEVEEPQLLEALDSPDSRIFTRLLTLVSEQPEYTLNHILGYWRGLYDQSEAEYLAELAALDLMRSGEHVVREDLAEFRDGLQSMYRIAKANRPGKQLLEDMAARDVVAEQDIKLANSAWQKLSAEERVGWGNRLLGEILSKPRA